MTHVVAALTLASLAAIFIFNVYLLLRYLIVADALRKLLGSSSGDRKKPRLQSTTASR